jgi:ribosomal protein S27AE
MKLDEYDPDDPLKDASKCPHCGGLGIVVPHDDLRYVCGLCGGPRIRVDDDLELSGDEIEPLRAGEQSRKSRFLWRVAGLFGAAAGGFGVLVSVFAALLLGWGWGLGGVVMSLPFILLAIAGFAKASSKTDEMQAHIHQAWKLAARDVVERAQGGVDAKRLAEIMHLTDAGAEQMMADLTVDNMFRSSITDDGRLRVEPMTSIRVDPAAQPAGKTLAVEDDLEARFEALEEALEDEQAAKQPPRTQRMKK